VQGEAIVIEIGLFFVSKGRAAGQKGGENPAIKQNYPFCLIASQLDKTA
jgi:hypothetical protein